MSGGSLKVWFQVFLLEALWIRFLLLCAISHSMVGHMLLFFYGGSELLLVLLPPILLLPTLPHARLEGGHFLELSAHDYLTRAFVPKLIYLFGF